MSILQISSNENVSSILHSLSQAKPADIEWPHYAQFAAQQMDSDEKKLNKKRAMARKFLRAKGGKPAGQSYRKDASCVFTPQFVKDLGCSNAAHRSRRNPWLGSMASEQVDSDLLTSSNANVVQFATPFGPQIIAQNKTSDIPR